MESSFFSLFDGLVDAIALPYAGLLLVFVVSLLSSTLLPMGSEAVLLAYINGVPDFFWQALVFATAGNTLGGVITFWMGMGAEALYERYARSGQKGRWSRRAHAWVERWGAPVLLLSWLPVVGDPLCAVAGWLRLPFWRSFFYIAVGKALRYGALALSAQWFLASG